MRIVIDMQGAQTESRFRGIGRYTLSFAQAVVRNRGEHEVFLALSGLFPDTIEPIRAAFDSLLPQANIRVWHAPGPVAEGHAGNDTRREVAEIVREAFLASLQPDVIHICSLFEGYVDDAVISIGRFDTFTPISVTAHDLIPLLNPDQYLKPNPRYDQYYQKKIKSLKKARVYLAVSESSRMEVVAHAGVEKKRVFNTSEAVESYFKPLAIGENIARELLSRFRIFRPFVLYTGGADERKNLPRLIQAYAVLPLELRRSHQLVFAGKMPEGDIARFRQVAQSAGLQPDELRFTGYVSDEELVQLYNLCALYVFPSWHEGFGLPALEAMACGAPVIGANTSSLPEVIGLEAALFDPFDVASIAAKMQQSLTDNAFRAALQAHGLQQAKRFSWDETARRAINTWESLSPKKKLDWLDSSLEESHFYERLVPYIAETDEVALSRLADSLAINQQAGLQRQLLVDVSEICQHDAATGVQRVVRSYLKELLENPPAGFRVEPVYATREHPYRYARSYTQRLLGDSEQDILDTPIRWQRGDIFFGLDMQHHVQLAHADFFRQIHCEGVTVKFLVYDLLPIQLSEMFRDSDASALHGMWLKMIAAGDGAISISKATADAYDEWMRESGVSVTAGFQNDWVHIGADIAASHPTKGLPGKANEVLEKIRQRITFLCVATLEPRKGQQQILDAVELLWHTGSDVNLVFVGQQGWKIDALAKRIQAHPENGHRLFWLKGISDEYLELVYASSTCLIAASLNEGFGLPLIEAARHGIPIIARDIPVFREVADEGAFYFIGDKPEDLSNALIEWINLHSVGKTPDVKSIRWSTWRESTEKLKAALTCRHYPRRQLLVDISELVQRDAKTGIQRVVRNVLREWLSHPPSGWRVEPVYATVDQPYRYARQFTSSFLGVTTSPWSDEPIDYEAGDVFFALDLQPQIQTYHADFYQKLRRQGVIVKFLVHDLLCILQPQYFVQGASEGFSNWLKVVCESDGVICVSKSVADDLSLWMKKYSWQRKRGFSIGWSYNGANIEGALGHKEKRDKEEIRVDRICSGFSFLMVGTIEPRKGHAQVLDAFESLWQNGTDVNLVIVGKQGWMVEPLVKRLRTHPEREKRLFWLEGISDEYLEKVYAASTCLIAASYGEGFGLPLIEAAQHKLPILARDIPVFREVAGEHASYFSAQTAEALAQAIQVWLSQYQLNQHPKSNDMPWLTWKESARILLARLGVEKNMNPLLSS